MVLIGSSQKALASIISPWKYLMQYQLGIELGDTTDRVSLVFEPSENSYSNDKFCSNEDEKTICKIPYQQRSSNYGFFLQQPFERQGLWYINWDVSLGLKFLSGDYKLAEDDEGENVPYSQISMNALSFTIYPYIVFGITPKSFWPDLLISFSPVVGEAVFGNAKIGDDEFDFKNGVFRRTQMLSIPTIDFDLILVRFGDGYFGLHYSNLVVDSHVSSHPKIIDGDLNELVGVDSLDLEIARNFVGFRLLFK